MKLYLIKGQSCIFNMHGVPPSHNAFITTQLSYCNSANEEKKLICDSILGENSINQRIKVSLTPAPRSYGSVDYFTLTISKDPSGEDGENIPILKKFSQFPGTTVSVLIENFESDFVTFIAKDMQISKSGNCFMQDLRLPSGLIRQSDEVDEYSFTGKVTISLKLTKEMCEDLIPKKTQPVSTELSISKKILEESLASDLIIKASNGAEIECHKSFLSAHSPVLRAMFESGMKESKTNEMDMSDMSEEGVKAFLEYLYYWDIATAIEDCQIALELFCAGDKYIIPKLKESMKNLLEQKTNDEYTVNIGIHLFCYVRNMESAENLKMKAVNVLRTKFKEMEASKEYKGLFVKHPEAAMELCRYFALVQN